MPKSSAASVSVWNEITRVKVRRFDSARADTNDVPTFLCIPRATDPAAQTVELSPTPPNRVLAVDVTGVNRPAACGGVVKPLVPDAPTPS